MDNDAFELLKMDYPIFEIRNRRSYPAIIDLIGDDVQIPGFATSKVESNKLYQLPDLSTFELKNPNMEILIERGVIGGKNDIVAAPVAEPVKVDDKSVASPEAKDEPTTNEELQNKTATAINSAPGNRAATIAKTR